MRNESYIHPQSTEIESFIKELCIHNFSLEKLIVEIFEWFNKNISYSRLSAPYYPLQRSDLDLIRMRSGTCGDYANLVVSVLTHLGYQTKYAYLKIDCYGNPQDHICAAVLSDNQWILIDPTLPYRKWKGYDCPHKEYELISLEEFESKMKEEENYWTQQAITWNNKHYAGLLYAPWIHEEIVVNTDEILETVFFLLIFDSAREYSVYTYYLAYSKENATAPIMCRCKDNKALFRFSIKEAQNVWDEAQWGEEFLENEVPIQFQNVSFKEMTMCMNKTIPAIQKIVSNIDG